MSKSTVVAAVSLLLVVVLIVIHYAEMARVRIQHKSAVAAPVYSRIMIIKQMLDGKEYHSAAAEIDVLGRVLKQYLEADGVTPETYFGQR